MKSIHIFLIKYIIFYCYRKQKEEERKLQTKKELEEYENTWKKDLEDKKILLQQEQKGLEKLEEESNKELEEIQFDMEQKKDHIIEYIIDNIMKVNMEFPEMVKKRFVKKKKRKK